MRPGTFRFRNRCPLESETEAVATDCDILMNLLATGRAVEILRAVRLVLLVPPTVDREALFLESETPDDPRTPVDLDPLVQARVLSKVSLSDEEVEVVVKLAQSVDDGEAEVIAVGSVRQLAIATDDRKARRVASARGSQLMSTPDLLMRWQAASSTSEEEVARVLGLIGRRSRYRPPRSHSLYDWWMKLLVLDETHRSSTQ